MVFSLCRAGTVSAALLYGNQRTTTPPGQVPLMTKGCPNAYNSDKASEKSAKTYRRQTGKQRASALKKMSVQKSPDESRISRTDTTRLPSVIKKAMPHGIGENNESRSSNQNRRKPQRATPQNLLEPNPRTLRQRNPAVPHRHRPHHPEHRRPPRMLALQHRFRHESPRTYPKNTHHPRKHEEKTPRITPR